MNSSDKTSTVTLFDKYSKTNGAILGVLMSCFIIATLVGNIFVITAIISEKTLRNPRNFFILSLAITDYLLAILVMPLSLVSELSKRWPFSNSLCDLFTALDVMIVTVSIYHIVIIAADRYLAISRLNYTITFTTKRAASAIVVAWCIALGVCLVQLYVWKNTSNAKVSGICLVNQSINFAVFGTFFSFLFPATIIVFLNFKLYYMAKHIIGRKKFSRRLPQRSTVGVGVLSMVQTSEASRLQSSTGGTQVPSIVNPKKARVKRKSGRKIRVFVSMTEVLHEARESTSGTVKISADDMATSALTAMPSSARSTSQIRRITEPTDITKSRDTIKDDSEDMPIEQPHRKSSLLKIQRERKTVKVLVVITGCFLVCWLPFFLLVFIMPICQQHCDVPPQVISFFNWLGWANSGINPIIYTIFNPKFLTVFKRFAIVKCIMSLYNNSIMKRN